MVITRGRGDGHEQAYEPQPDPMQQILGMLTEQRGMIHELREELKEVKAKQNEDKNETQEEEQAERSSQHDS